MGDSEQGNGSEQQTTVVPASDEEAPVASADAEVAAVVAPAAAVAAPVAQEVAVTPAVQVATPAAPPVAARPGPMLPPGAVALTADERARMASMHQRLQDHKMRLAQLHLDVEGRKAVAARDPSTHLEKLANTLVEYEQRRTDILTEIHRFTALVQDQTSEMARAHGLSGERGAVGLDVVRGLLLPKTPPKF